MSAKVSPPSGFRDFLPDAMRLRKAVMEKIEGSFTRQGFEAMQTPVAENVEVLTGKYGEDEKLIFKILKRGDKLSKAVAKLSQSAEHSYDQNALCDLALRFDLTVPLSRYINAHRDKLPRIFKRYQLAPVFRADRPAKGRFREFYQCDIDIIGSESAFADVEVIQTAHRAYTALGLGNAVLRTNDRRILKALLEHFEVPQPMQGPCYIAIDKLDKVGAQGVSKELQDSGLAQSSCEGITAFLERCQQASSENNASIAKHLQTLLAVDALSPELQRLCEEMQQIVDLSPKGFVRFDPTMARGLDYYTHTIFEAFSPDFNLALGGGGRYNNLIDSMSGKKNAPTGYSSAAVGFSLGLERILDIITDCLNGEIAGESAKAIKSIFSGKIRSRSVFLTFFDKSLAEETFKLCEDLRDAGIDVFLYPEPGKYSKQLKYAVAGGYTHAVFLGPDQLQAGEIKVSKLGSGSEGNSDAFTLPRNNLKKLNEALQQV